VAVLKERSSFSFLVYLTLTIQTPRSSEMCVTISIQADTMHHPRKLESFFLTTENISQCALTSKSCICIKQISVLRLLIFARKTHERYVVIIVMISRISRKENLNNAIEITNTNKTLFQVTNLMHTSFIL